MPKLSIIVPVYNAEIFLDRCIDSILSQGFNAFELLLINDGSTDSSYDICKKYTLLDSRIRLIDQPNGGVSSARNKGLSLAVGEWVLFVDSDDYLVQDSLENVFNNLREVDLFIGAAKFSSSAQLVKLDGDNLINGGKLAELIERYISHPLLSAPWAKLFRREIIERHNLRFNEALCFGEDAVFVKEYILNVNDIQLQDTAFYFYEDIGDAIYEKYNRSFTPILEYYSQLSNQYNRIGQKFRISVSTKELIGVVYNMAVKCLDKRGLTEWQQVRCFLLDSSVRLTLQSRNSWYINSLLEVASWDNAFIFMMFFRLFESVKRFFVK